MRLVGLCAALFAFLIVACSPDTQPSLQDPGEPPSSEPPGTPGPASTVIIEEGAVQDGAQPGSPFEVETVIRITDDEGRSVEGVLVHFQVVTEGGGEFQVLSLLTNSSGRVYNQWIAGTVAWTARLQAGQDSFHVAEVVLSRDGRPDVVETVYGLVEPGPPHRWRTMGLADYGVFGRRLKAGDPVPLAEDFGNVLQDEWGNFLSAEQVAELVPTWEYRRCNRTSAGLCVEEAVGPTGEGWDAGPFPDMHVQGWRASTLWRCDQRATDGPAHTPQQCPDEVGVRGYVQLSLEGVATASSVGTRVRAMTALPICWSHSTGGGFGDIRWVAGDWFEGCPNPTWEDALAPIMAGPPDG